MGFVEYLYIALISVVFLLVLLAISLYIFSIFHKKVSGKSVEYELIKENILKIDKVSSDLKSLQLDNLTREARLADIEQTLIKLREITYESSVSISGNSDRITLMSRLIGG